MTFIESFYVYFFQSFFGKNLYNLYKRFCLQLLKEAYFHVAVFIKFSVIMFYLAINYLMNYYNNKKLLFLIK